MEHVPAGDGEGEHGLGNAPEELRQPAQVALVFATVRAHRLVGRAELAERAAAAGLAVGVVAGMRYRALSNRSLPLDQAIKLRDDGKRPQTAGLALSGPAAVAAEVGILGLVRSPRDGAPSWSASPIAGGAMITVGGSLP